MPLRVPWRPLIKLAVVLLVLGWIAVVAAVVVTSRRDDAAPSDAIAVLGAAQYNGRPSPVFRARLDRAIALYSLRMAPLILVTGGVGLGDTLSEAAVGRRYLVLNGIPDSAAIALPPASSTVASVERVAAWFAGRPRSRVVLVSDGFHLLRLRIIAARRGLDARTSPAPDSPITASRRSNAGYILAESVKVPVTWLFLH